jgi:hypothetical protein
VAGAKNIKRGIIAPSMSQFFFIIFSPLAVIEFSRFKTYIYTAGMEIDDFLPSYLDEKAELRQATG